MLLRLLTTALLFSANHVDAFSAWTPPYTPPPDGITWVSSPQVRGTMSIIWSCLSVLLICTWTIQHLSVPPHIEPKKHSWNRKFVADARYSSFLDDLRFNIKKTKWMLGSFIAPEYILAKALMEFLAARDSQKQFGMKEWTTTHAYFANMRGFILRFNVAAVPTSLEPTKAGDFERSLQNPTPDGDPPYFEQSAQNAEDIELTHCHKICGIPCKNRPDESVENEKEPVPNPQAPPNMQGGNKELQKLEVPQREATTVQAMPTPATPNDTGNRPLEDSMTLSPCTLLTSTPNSTVHRHGYPMNTTPITSVDTPDLPFDTTPDTLTNDRPLQMSNTTQTSTSNSSTTLPDVPTQSNIAKPALGPHKPWPGQWALSSLQMHYAYREGIIPLPPVTAEDLNDRSKGDALVKLAAVLQITFLIVQIIARAFQALAITQLEITVLAFAACAIVTYFLLLRKPQDVKVPIYIDAIPKVLTREMIIGLAARSAVSTLMVHQYWLHGVAIRAMADSVFPWTPGIKIFVPRLMKEPIYFNPVFLGIGFGGVVFGGIHIAAWDFAFPSAVERLLWQISCSYLVVMPLFGTLFYCVSLHFERAWSLKDNRINKILRPLGKVFVPLYFLARLYLLVEVFRCLAYPPTSTFRDVNWPTFIPHVN